MEMGKQDILMIAGGAVGIVAGVAVVLLLRMAGVLF